MAWNLAQLNIARMMFEKDGPQMKDFTEALEPVNASAESSPGFVWRLKSDGENPEEDLIFGEPGWLVNLSVWESLDALVSFIRSDLHLSIMKRRREWFEAQGAATLVLWWVPAGHEPSVEEAQERLAALRENGPMPFAFSFANPFPSPADEPG